MAAQQSTALKADTFEASTFETSTLEPEAVTCLPIETLDAAASRRDLRVCVGASSGGHLAELLALLERRDAWYSKPCALVTTMPVGPDLEAEWGRAFVIGECNRHTPRAALAVMQRSWQTVAEVKPDVFITTGSMPMLFVAAAVKARGGRVVWIDSVARVDGLSWSASVARYFVDLCLTQWPEVARKYRGVDYAGEVF